MDEEPRPLQVREELVAEPDALVRALDEPRHVGDRELASVGRLDGAEHRRDRRERIVRDLRLRVRDPPQERGLAGVREPEQRRVGEELQPELELALLPGLADLCDARRLIGRRREALVACPAEPAAGHDGSRARVGEIGDEPPLRVEDLRADRDA